MQPVKRSMYSSMQVIQFSQPSRLLKNYLSGGKNDLISP
jgi:hypothetical protein